MTNQSIICPQCEKGHLAASVYADDFQHAGSPLHVEGLECYICDRCGADPVFADQIRRNHRRIADAKRRADKMLTGDDIRSLRDQLGLTQQDAAQLFGGGTNAFSKYERGDVIQSDSMDRLLKVARLYPFLVSALREMAGMDGPLRTLDQDYSQGTQVCVNDGNYRSRTVRGTSVVVDMSDWKDSRVA